ncbi:arylsulfatase B-like [Ixodes scapularis]|uniref:arylsulfatase B-like n=1 Tax=Ixodes scapularis TaxID=6945 RepID=UPI001A9D33CE|nr:arylsulfatase B-like [Ixodes scapularis]
MRPNIIFLFIDDLGWDDVSFHGSPQIPTPNMDVLAADGIILNNYYVQPVCTPSRAALMTGLYPIHTGMQHSVLMPAQPYGLPLEVTIMPQHFKNLGYETHMIGKWNLGNYKLTYTPTYRGFDSFYGYYSAGEDYYNHTVLWDNRTGLDFWLNTEPLRNVSGIYSSHLYTERAKSLIKNRDASKPFYLYLAYQSVHCGNDDDLLQAPQENIDKFPYIGERNRTIYAGMVDALDESIGEVFQALGDAGMLGNTIIALSSDNGGLPIGAHSNRGFNFPLRGGKGTLWEGGCRATGFIWSPLLKRKGVVSDQMMHITDWLPTLYSAAGGNPLSLGKLDGTDMWAPLSIGYASPRYEILYNIDPIDNNSALRYTNYKLVLGITEDGQYDPRFLTTGGSRPYDDLDLLMVQSTAARVLRDLRNKGDLQFPDQWREKATLNCGNKVPKNFVSLAPPYLFDLASDPCEINNIASSQAGLVAFLRGRIQSYAQTAAATINQPTDPNGYPENLNGTWGSWIT